MQEPSGVPAGRDSLDAIATDLQQLRMQRGEVPYAEIVRRIGKLREAQGADPAVARPGRTTVYDVFRTGRSRINVSLVGEIVTALGCSEVEARQWELRCVKVRTESYRAEEYSAPKEPGLPTPKSLEAPSAIEKPTVIDSELPTEDVASVTPPAVSEKAKEPTPTKPLKFLFLSACLVLNVLGFWLIAQTGFPLYLDMIGTAIAAIVFGPWTGAAIGMATNLIGLGITDESSAAFGLVNVAGALVWGYGARAIRSGNVISKFVALNVTTALTCSVVATALLLFIFGGSTGHGSEITMNSLLAKTNSLVIAVFNSNIMYSLVDKLLTGFLAITLIGAVSGRFKAPLHQEVEKEAQHLFRRFVHLCASSRRVLARGYSQ